jgi:hypothetical protein
VEAASHLGIQVDLHAQQLAGFDQVVEHLVGGMFLNNPDTGVGLNIAKIR